MTKKKFYSKWIDTFGASVSSKDLKKYVISNGNYLWHVFSWELIPKSRYLDGKAAKEAYDRIDKCDAIYIDWFEDDTINNITRDLNCAKDLDRFVEVYVVGKDFEWTYIKTHEDVCGPYFMKIK